MAEVNVLEVIDPPSLPVQIQMDVCQVGFVVNMSVEGHFCQWCIMKVMCCSRY